MKNYTEEAIQIIELGHSPTVASTKIVLMNAALMPNDLIFELGKLLSPKELKKSSRFRLAKDRRVYIAGRGLLRRLAGEVIGISPEDFEVEEGAFGKPHLHGFEKLLPFNISNSGEVIAIAFDFANREVGVDLEIIDPEFDYFDVAGYYFSEKECARIYSHSDFYKFWTMKEALLKVTGVGLVDDLPLMDLSSRQNRIKVRDERLLPFINKSYTIHTFQNDDIVLSLAVSGAQLPEPKSGSRLEPNLFANNQVTVTNVYLH
jgi:4'-phosphopantetheinyl transferase